MHVAEDLLPTNDASGAVGVVIDAGPERAREALLDADLFDVGGRKPMAGLLTAVRMVPELVRGLARGKLPSRPPKQPRLRDTAAPSADDGGGVLPGETLALGRGLLTGLMRTTTTDERARDMFRCSWTRGIGSGAHVRVHGVLEPAREIAEHEAPSVHCPPAGADRAVTA